MSAYILDIDEIRFMVQAAEYYGRRWNGFRWGSGRRLSSGDLEEEQRIGQMLWDENVASVRHRYPEDAIHELPGPIDGAPFNYTHERDHCHINPMQVVKCCDCYEYQSCEHPGWATSEAKQFVDALRLDAIRSHPDYEAADWGGPKRKAHAG